MRWSPRAKPCDKVDGPHHGLGVSARPAGWRGWPCAHSPHSPGRAGGGIGLGGAGPDYIGAGPAVTTTTGHLGSSGPAASAWATVFPTATTSSAAARLWAGVAESPALVRRGLGGQADHVAEGAEQRAARPCPPPRPRAVRQVDILGRAPAHGGIDGHGGRHRVHQHQAGDPAGIAAREQVHVQPRHRMAHQDKGAGLARRVQQPLQVIETMARPSRGAGPGSDSPMPARS